MAARSDNLQIDLLRPYIDAAFTTSPGPGGQNVNKVSTRVTLLFDFENCPAISDPVKARIRSRLATRLSRDGRLRISSHKERSQSRNRAAAEQKLIELIAAASHAPKPRRATKPTLGSRRRRVEEKRRRAEIKSQRSRPIGD